MVDVVRIPLLVEAFLGTIAVSAALGFIMLFAYLYASDGPVYASVEFIGDDSEEE